MITGIDALDSQRARELWLLKGRALSLPFEPTSGHFVTGIVIPNVEGLGIGEGAQEQFRPNRIVVWDMSFPSDDIIGPGAVLRCLPNSFDTYRALKTDMAFAEVHHSAVRRFMGWCSGVDPSADDNTCREQVLKWWGDLTKYCEENDREMQTV